MIDVDSDSAAGEWFINAFSQRSKCNEPEFLEVGNPIDFLGMNPIDFLGMDLHRTDDGHFVSMENHVKETIHVLDVTHSTMAFQAHLGSNFFGPGNVASFGFFVSTLKSSGFFQKNCG